jgi:8-oxo-dGTP pyrophosphatase MutT (NUDIX family)
MSARDEGVFVVALMEAKNQSPQVLLQIRKNTGLHDGKFVFPGGKREDNETWQDAAKRELYEETGLIVKKDRIQKLCQYGGRDQDGTQWLVMFYLCFIDPFCICRKAEVKEPKKHTKVEWHPLDKLPKNVPSVVRRVISDLKLFLSKAPHSPKGRKIVAAGLRNAIYDISKNHE